MTPIMHCNKNFLQKWLIRWLITIMAMMLSVVPSWAALKITIRQGTIKTVSLAMANVTTRKHKSDDAALAKNLIQVINDNLSGSGLFEINDDITNSKKIKNFYSSPAFSRWQKFGNQFLLQTDLVSNGKRLVVRAKLWDLAKRKNILGRHGIMLSTNKDNWRRLAHQLSDDIYTRLIGEKGYFDSRIVFIAETGNKKNRTKRLAIIDQDGKNLQYISDGRYLVLTPRFSNNLQKISYLSYQNKKPTVYILDVETGISRLIGAYDGMTLAPRFSPDNKKIIFSYELNGATNIYVKKLKSTSPATPLTRGNYINISPCYSPDGKFITFTSDRTGSPQIYVMRSNGKDIKRISYGDGQYSTPVWSPRGDYIAFTKQSKDVFYIGIVKPDGSGERLLSKSFLDEGPTWSPNGRVVAFFRQKTASDTNLSLWTVDITGNFLKKIYLPVGGSDPAWSPLTPR
ncbi:MAG: Tol-Pal system beta propeller repeat protein TolB [Alphaproteobacteria bacterium]